MAYKQALRAVAVWAALATPAGAQTQGPDTLTTPMHFAGALVGAEVMLIEYSKSPCGPLGGRRFGVNSALDIAAPFLAPSERQTLTTYVRANAADLHTEYRRLIGENLRTLQGQGMALPDACVVVLNVYDTAYRAALAALKTARSN